MRIESLTGLRFIAALGVLVCHFQILLPLDAPLQLIANIGGDGVLLFFCLSGLVITLSLSQHRDTSLSSYRKNSLRHYFYARVARILPIYWLSVLATLVFIASYGLKSSLYAQVSPESTLEVFLSLGINLLALQAWFYSISIQQFWNAPAWSVSAEIFFYVIAPFVFFKRKKFLTLFAFLTVTLFFLIVSGKIFYSSEFVYLPEYLQRLPCFGLIAFLSGHLVGLKILAELTEYRTSRQGGRFKLFLLVVLSLILGFLRQFWGPNTLPGIFIYYLCLIPIFCYLIYVVASHDNQVTRLLGSSIFRLLGNSSYCLYLNHWIVLTVVSYYLSSSSGGGEDGGPPAITSGYLTLFEFGGLIVMTVLASIVLYQRVECVARKHILLLAEKRRLLS